MNKKFLYVAVVVFLITQICIAWALMGMSIGGVEVFITNNRIEVEHY